MWVVNSGPVTYPRNSLPFLSCLKRLGDAVWLFANIGGPLVKTGLSPELCEIPSGHEN